ncbi:gamma-glutamyltransferase [Actibacterium mucosum KCTC 23349]|uniref:Gamma-glutamyltransferase n=1 Tax=Actibacterium mucosum KCTC 23349 TaxID=1454373 RepID=A0A037ZNF4_9RHOB|nr:gamma-glutamyltransferase [Actibacterium mucosum KCTC 23349]
METSLGYAQAMTAPHRLASLAGHTAMAEGATAIEAMVCAAATIAVVYPHMNGLGGDAFWTIKRRGEAPVTIAGCGGAGAKATRHWYAERGITDALPARGPLAAVTVPGAVGTWQMALSMVPAAKRWALADLLAPAIHHARAGVAMSRHQAEMTSAKLDQVKDQPGFAEVFLNNGAAPSPGWRLRQEALAGTLETLAAEGCDSFYKGDLARTHAGFLAEIGSPICLSDFESYAPERQDPLQIKTSWGTLYNTRPPTQGVASLAILGTFDRLGIDPQRPESPEHIHGLVESIKQAYLMRNRELGDPGLMQSDAQDLLSDAALDDMAGAIDLAHARSWPETPRDGDTIWMGAVDRDGTVVSFIQSLFWEFGSAVVCPETGVMFQNRGADFLLDDGLRGLAPGRLPFHTLNPAMAELNDGRVMAYGTQGGEGQPQTQAAVFSRYAHFGVPLQDAICRPRWLLGKSWGEESTSLKLEEDFGPELIAAMENAGHTVDVVRPCDPLMGQAGAVVAHPDGQTEAATDPRSDGAALAI